MTAERVLSAAIAFNDADTDPESGSHIRAELWSVYLTELASYAQSHPQPAPQEPPC